MMLMLGCTPGSDGTKKDSAEEQSQSSSVQTENTSTSDSSQTSDTEKDPSHNLPVSGSYSLMFEENFDSPLDLSKWRYRTDEKGGGSNLAANVSVADGKLKIKFDKQKNTYTGGGIISKELFGYGYYETKCTLFAEGGGLHSAFWLMGGSGNGISLPKANTVFEIDGFEFDSNKPDTISFNLNYKIGTVYGDINKYTVPSLSKREAVCGFEWMPDRISWYLDGKLMHTVDAKDQPLFYSQQALWLTALANTSMSGSINDSLLPAYSSFEYFRYYAKPLKDINLIGAGGFEYNDNIGHQSKTDMQTPLSFCEKGDTHASYIERSDQAYSGNCMLVHKSTKAFDVSTYQKLYNIPNGSYSASVTVRSSQKNELCTLTVTDHGEKSISVDIPASDTWQKVTIDSIPVTANTATLTVRTKGGSDGWLYIDEVCFSSNDGEVTKEAAHYPDVYSATESVGEILVNTRSSSYKNSGGWKRSSVIGAEYASEYKLNATESDYVSWSEKASVSGEYILSVYNVESSSKVQKQKAAVYSDGKQLCIFDTGSKAGWEELGTLTLNAGQVYEIRIENTAQNKTMRADSAKLTPKSTLSYSECIMMHTDRSYAYIYSHRTNINNIPSPVYKDAVLYLPKAWLESAIGKSIDAPQTQINGIDYINAQALDAVGMHAVYADNGTVMISDLSQNPDISTVSAAIDMFR